MSAGSNTTTTGASEKKKTEVVYIRGHLTNVSYPSTKAQAKVTSDEVGLFLHEDLGRRGRHFGAGHDVLVPRSSAVLGEFFGPP